MTDISGRIGNGPPVYLFAERLSLRSFEAVNRQKFRMFLVVALLASAAFAVWSWVRPYEWRPDPAALCRIAGAQVRKDRGYFWVDLHVKVAPGMKHDLLKPVRLVTAAGEDVEPAETTMAGEDSRGTTDLWFKFWLEADRVGGPLKLRINDGVLTVRTGSGPPDLGVSDTEFFPTCDW